MFKEFALTLLALAATVAIAQAADTADMLNGKVCPVTMDGRHSGAFVFTKTGAGLQAHVYRSTTRAFFDEASKAIGPLQPIIDRHVAAKTLEDQGVHPVKQDGQRLKLNNGFADIDLDVRADGSLNGNAHMRGSTIVIQGPPCGR